MNISCVENGAFFVGKVDLWHWEKGNACALLGNQHGEFL